MHLGKEAGQIFQAYGNMTSTPQPLSSVRPSVVPPYYESWLLPWKWRRGRRRLGSLAAAAAAHSNLDKLHLLSTLVEDGQLQVRSEA